MTAPRSLTGSWGSSTRIMLPALNPPHALQITTMAGYEVDIVPVVHYVGDVGMRDRAYSDRIHFLCNAAQLKDTQSTQPALFDVLGLAPSPIVRVTLEALTEPSLRLKEPIELRVYIEGGLHVVEAVGLNEFGNGADPVSALNDLQEGLVSLYTMLEEEQANLGPDLQRVWETLQRKVERA